MKQKLKIGLSITGFVLLIVAAVFAYNALKGQVDPNKNTDPVAEQNKASDFTMTDMDGNSVKLSDIIANGKPVVLNFWASWCPPCKGEMPEFESAYKEFGGEVQFIMLDLVDGQRETVETGAKYIESQGYTFPVYFDAGQEGASAYGIRSIPTTLFIDKDGYITGQTVGAISENTLKSEINKIK